VGEQKFYECQCHTADHIIYVDTDGDEVIIGVQLAPLHSVWGRIVNAVKYIINPHGRFSHWSETVLSDEQVAELRGQLASFAAEDHSETKFVDFNNWEEAGRRLVEDYGFPNSDKLKESNNE